MLLAAVLMYFVFIFLCNLGKHSGKNLCLLNKYLSYCSLASVLLYSSQMDSPKPINSKKIVFDLKHVLGHPDPLLRTNCQDDFSFSLDDTIFNKVPWPKTIFLNGYKDLFSNTSSLKFSVIWETQLITVHRFGKAIRSSTKEQQATNLHIFAYFHFSFLPFARSCWP